MAGVGIVLGLWNAPPKLLGDEAGRAMGAEAVVASMGEAAVRLTEWTGTRLRERFREATIP